MFVKPLFKTLLLSSLIFGLVVILGLKYQWVDYLKSADKDNIALVLPQDSIPRLIEQTGLAEKQGFQLEIIRSDRQPVTANMTKEQITSGCQQLYNKMGMHNNELIDVVVGDCVVSNYQEAIQNSSQFTTVQQEQHQMAIKKACFQKSNAHSQLSPFEKQLLLGVCVSDGANQ
ncbi:MAG: hypothetical protein V3V19_09190 [Cocleimonas sp.]